MLVPPRVGTVAERRFTVEPSHAVHFAEAGLPPVLSTPWLVWFMEHAALDAAGPALEAGEITVGIHLEVEHLAPTPVGATVVCKARVVHAEGAVISFQIEARDDHELVARGFHKRSVVQAQRLAGRLRRKTAPKQRG
jgi:predicted thioesterase